MYFFFYQLEEIPLIVKALSIGQRTWEDVLNNYPLFEQQEATKEKWGWKLIDKNWTQTTLVHAMLSLWKLLKGKKKK